MPLWFSKMVPKNKRQIHNNELTWTGVRPRFGFMFKSKQKLKNNRLGYQGEMYYFIHNEDIISPVSPFGDFCANMQSLKKL